MADQKSALLEVPYWKRDAILFWSFFKISTVVIGGGYAIIAAAREDFIRRRWITEDEFIELVTVTQTVPGILAGNTAVCMGWKVDRWRGAAAALLGAIVPSVVIIVAIAAGMSQLESFLESPAVQGAFRGVISGIVGLVLVTALKMRRKSVPDIFSAVVAVAALLGLSVFRINPGWIIVAAIIAGISCEFIRRRSRRLSHE